MTPERPRLRQILYRCPERPVSHWNPAQARGLACRADNASESHLHRRSVAGLQPHPTTWTRTAPRLCFASLPEAKTRLGRGLLPGAPVHFEKRA